MTSPKRATQSGAGPTDAALVLAARAGEPWAQEALFRRYARMVNALAHRLMANEAETDDLVQDAFIQAFSGLERLHNPQAFSSWIGSIVVRTAHKRLRRQRLMARLGLRRSEPIDIEQVVSRDAAPDAAAEARVLYRLVEALPAEERVMFILRKVEGLTVAAIAQQTGKSVATVKRRIASAQSSLELLTGHRQGEHD